MARHLFSIASGLAIALAAATAAAQVPVVTIDRPTDGTIVQAEPCSFEGSCTAKVTVRVTVSAAVALATVDLRYRPVDRTWFSSLNLCGNYDPIETFDGDDPRCGSSTSLSRTQTVSLVEGRTHELIVNAEDVAGRIGTARVTVSVEPPRIAAIGAATLTATDPAYAELIPPLRDPGALPVPEPRFVSGEIVTLYGDNLDRLEELNYEDANKDNNYGDRVFVEVFLSPMLGEYDEQYLPAGGLPTADWCKHKADIVRSGNDASRGSFVQVRVPEVPEQVLVDCRYGGTLTRERSQVFWRWIVRDRYDRAERAHEYLVLPNPYLPRASRTAAFRIHDAPYPHLYGFGFENMLTGATVSEYLSVYGYNAYLCVGLIVCLSHVPDPVYLIFFPAYYAVLEGANGSCVGMAATSLLMRKGYLSPQQFDEGVLYPAGFTDDTYHSEYATSSILGQVTEPPHPVNLWATIRTNHGVQVSAEFIGRFLAQVGSKPRDQYLDIQQNPLSYVTSMWSTSKGHVVTPYAALNEEIAVYDNNDPGLEQTIPIDAAGGFVEYKGKQYVGLANFPIGLWREPRHMPLDLPHLWYSLVFGAADPSYETENGRWGWDASGSLTEALPGAVPVAPLGAAGDSRTIPLLIPDERPVKVSINTRGETYTYHGAHGGNLIQFRVAGASTGEVDQVSLSAVAGAGLGEVGFTAGSSPRTLTPVLGLASVERERIVFALSKLRAPAGGRLAFAADPAARSVRYTNGSAVPTRHVLIVSTADGPSGSTSSRSFGPFEVPAGAVQTASIDDWPAATRIAWQIDLNGDGTADRQGVTQGTDCAPDDLDADGLSDACQALPVGELQGQGSTGEGCACSNAGGAAPSPASVALVALLVLVALRSRRWASGLRS